MIVLTPSIYMLCRTLSSEDGITITLIVKWRWRVKMHSLLPGEHPLIRNGLDLILSGDTGSSTISLLKNKALPGRYAVGGTDLCG